MCLQSGKRWDEPEGNIELFNEETVEMDNEIVCFVVKQYQLYVHSK